MSEWCEHGIAFRCKDCRIEELEARLKAGCEDMADECPARTCGLADKLQSRIGELEAKLKRVEEVRDDLATQCINDRAYHAVKMLNKALKEKDDE